MPRTVLESEAAPVLDSERLRLRPVRRDDLPAVVELAGDRQVAEWTARIPHPYTLADAEAWYAACTDTSAGRAELVLAIERRRDGAFIGAIDLVIGPAEAPAELGFWLGRPYWNQGYMTEAVRRLIAYAFDELALPAVRACAFLGNAASARVQEKVGMRFVSHGAQAAPARACCERQAEIRELARADWRG
jgi:RimJ/RimL family protein N-acetyltransferase